MSAWKHEYLERAQHIIAMRNGGAQINAAIMLEDQLREGLCGKLAVWQCLDLIYWLNDMPHSQASALLTSLMPQSVYDYHAELSFGC